MGLCDANVGKIGGVMMKELDINEAWQEAHRQRRLRAERARVNG